MTDDDAKNLQALTKEQQVQYLQREIEALRNRPPPSPQATCWTPWMDDLERLQKLKGMLLTLKTFSSPWPCCGGTTGTVPRARGMRMT